MRQIEILSEYSYNGYIHINQILAESLSVDNNVVYVDRYYLKVLPSLRNIQNVFRNVFRSHRLILDKTSNPNLIIDNCLGLNIPWFTCAYKYADVSFIFLPNINAYRRWKTREIKVYYCTHNFRDFTRNPLILALHEKILKEANLVLTDNISNIQIQYRNESKVRIIPAPIPDDFIIAANSDFDLEPNTYDFIYFGSIDRKFDYSILVEILNKSYKVLIVGDEPSIKHEGLFRMAPTRDMYRLVGYINQARNILLPYKNDDFVNNITPGKIYQCLYTEKPIYCSNTYLCAQFGLNPVEKLGDNNYNVLIHSRSSIEARASQKAVISKIQNWIY